MEEIWKLIEPSDGKYEVSNQGKIRNALTLRVLKETQTRRYCYVSMHYGSKHVRKRIHVLVAKAFIDNPFNLPQINHKDEDPSNNCVENLEWCTASYNATYGKRNKKMLETRRERRLKTRPKEVLQLKLSGELVSKYESIMEAYRKTGVDFSNISKCCRDGCYNKTAGGFIWKYSDKT